MDNYNSLLIAGIVPTLLWIYIVSCFQKTVFYNLYVNRVRTLLFKPVTFAQRLLPEKTPDWAAALLLMAAYALLRCLYTWHGAANFAGAGALMLLLGFALMLLSPLTIICQLNIIRAAMEWRGQRARGAGGVRECLDAACWPLPRAGKPWMSALASLAAFLAIPLLVWASGALLATAEPAAGQEAGVPSFAFTMQNVDIVLRSAMRDALNTLLLLRAIVMACFIASLAGPLFGRMDISGMANEWLDSISRIFTDRKIGVGIFDFTPVIIYFAAGWLHAFLTN
jgi:hypothetical protein